MRWVNLRVAFRIHTWHRKTRVQEEIVGTSNRVKVRTQKEKNKRRKESAGKLVMWRSKDPAVTLLVWWHSLVKGFSRWLWEGTRLRAWCCFHQLSVSRTSHRIWVAFLALKSSGVSSSTVSPLPFTPSSRSLLYSLYRTEEEQSCEKGTQAGQAKARRYTVWAQSHQQSQQTKDSEFRSL